MRRDRIVYASLLAVAGGALVVDRALIGYEPAPPAPSEAAAVEETADPGARALSVLAALEPSPPEQTARAADAAAPEIRDIFRAEGASWAAFATPGTPASNTPAPAAESPPPDLVLTSVSLGSPALAVFRGLDPKRLDDPVPGGWRIDAISARSVTLRRGGRTHRIALVGDASRHASVDPAR